MTSSDRPPLRARDRVMPLGAKTYVMAIVNLTVESFSGDGVGNDVETALRRAVRAEADGADIVDVGGESARADAPVRDTDEEAAVVGEAMRRIAAECGLVISVDTYKPAVAETALQAGAHMINDIAGFTLGSGTAEVAAGYGAAFVVNFTLERPRIRPRTPPVYEDLIGHHLEFLRRGIGRAREAGMAPEAIVVDPGIAFGKSHDEDLQVLRRLDEFRALGAPLLVAASRKHVIGSVTGLPPPDRDAATAAVTALAIARGADIVRVHDVLANVQAARIADAIARGQRGDFAPTPQSWPWAAGAEPLPGTTIER